MRGLLVVLSCSALLWSDVGKAQKLYNQKKYTQAIEEAKKSTQSYSNPQLHLIWARSARALGKDIQAMSAYERVVMLSPKHTQAKKELARTYIALKKTKLAIQITQELKEESVDFEEIKVLNSTAQESNIKSNFSLAWGFDSNVNVHNTTQDLDVFYGTTLHTQKLASHFYLGRADIEYMQGFDSGIYLRWALDGYYKIITKESDYNLYLNTLNAGIGYYSSGVYNFYIPFSYTRLHYLSEDLLTIQSINPQIDYILNENFIVSLNSKFEKRTFQTDRDRDDKSVALGVTLYYKLGDNYLFFDSEHQRFNSNSNSYQDFTNKENFSVVAGLGYAINEKFKTVLSYKVRWSEYEDDVGTILMPNPEIRSDTYHQLNFKLTQSIGQNKVLFLENEYSKNNSNFIPAKYSKNTLLVGMSLSY